MIWVTWHVRYGPVAQSEQEQVFWSFALIVAFLIFIMSILKKL